MLEICLVYDINSDTGLKKTLPDGKEEDPSYHQTPLYSVLHPVEVGWPANPLFRILNCCLKRGGGERVENKSCWLAFFDSLDMGRLE